MNVSDGMRFERFGRAYHLCIRTDEDLLRAVDLDEAHWVATSAPIDTIRCDPVFLALLDGDGDRRIRAADVKAAVRWLFDHLLDRSAIRERKRSLSSDMVEASRPDGRRIRTALVKMLARLGRPADGALTLDEIRAFKSQVESMPVSDAGVVLPEAAGDAELRDFIVDVRAAVGGIPHPSGAVGIGQDQLDAFLEQARAYLDWHAKGQPAEEETASPILPLGAATSDAYAALADIRAKVDQYYAQCAAVALDGRLVAQMPPREGELAETDFRNPAAIETFLREAPLAPPRADWTLDLRGPVNPYYAARLARLREKVLRPLLQTVPDTLAEDEWHRVKERFAGHQEWLASKPGANVEPLGVAKLRRYLDAGHAAAVAGLIARSRETALELDNIRLAERLVLYQAHLLDFANNFVSFPQLYDPARRAVFETGTLVMDGRRFNMAVRAQNRAEHEPVAATSDVFVLYVTVAAEHGGRPYDVAVPVTSGGRGNLVVGKRGIFQDVDGREWDARVVHIIQNPISLSEAIMAPFKRLAGLITGKIEQLTSAAEKKLDTAAQQTVGTLGTAAAGAPAPPPSPQSRGLMAGGILAGGGVAIAALGSAVAYISKVVAEHNLWILAGIGGAILAVLMPSVVLAFIKLRRRDLSAILEGSGWAINARMRLSRSQTRYFTRRPPYPRGARGLALIRNWGWWLVFAALLIVAAGVVRSYVLRSRAVPRPPAASEPAPPVEGVPPVPGSP